MLQIYIASAGAGKTHRLTGDYLRLVFSGEYAYRRILAVTFTNKATEEMKRRILQELFVLSEDPSASGYCHELMELDRFSGMDDACALASVRNFSRSVLIRILHDYSSFNISTIDRFFQLVMRSFSREIGAGSNYRVELDTEGVLEAAIDRFYEGLDSPESSELLDWMVDLSVEAIEKGESWNVRKKISRIASAVFAEDFKIRSKDSTQANRIAVDRDRLAAFRSAMAGITDSFRRESVSRARRLKEVLESVGLAFTDLKGGQRSTFRKIADYVSGNVFPFPAAIADTDDSADVRYWCTVSRKDTVSAITPVLDSLSSCIKDLKELYDKGYEDYATASVIQKNIYVYGIMSDIYRHVSDYTKENNIVLLPQTNEVLNDLISQDDAPFIYEKTGTWIDSFMLDEFQDTSMLQWLNFRPLLQNSLASGNDSLVVGDVKQSIYRWRGSDWNILHRCVGEDTRGFSKRENLDENWRSMRTVMDFNNAFFTYAPAMVRNCCENRIGGPSERTSDIENVYSDVIQKMPECKKNGSRSGYVRLCRMDSSKGWQDRVMEDMPGMIEEFRSKGYGLGDMAFLVRSREEGQRLSSFLIGKGYNVVSEDSLLVSSSPVIASVISALRMMTGVETDSGHAEAYGDLDGLSFYEICETLVSKAFDGFSEDASSAQAPFANAFLDMVLEFVTVQGSDASAFLQWWERSGKKVRLAPQEGTDAVQVMTVHKSKGLGFRICVIPFLDDMIMPTFSSVIWRIPSRAPFDSIGIVPVSGGKELTETVFSGEYRDEMVLSCIDTLNLCYVAFTRAKDALVVYYPQAGKSVSRISDVLDNFVADPASKAKYVGNECIYNIMLEERDSSGISGMTVYEAGELAAVETHVSEKECMVSSYVDVPLGNRLKLSMRSVYESDENSRRMEGIVMHSVLQDIASASSVMTAVEAAVESGMIRVTEKERVCGYLEKILESVEWTGWFGDEVKVMNEKDLIAPDGKVKRPDRMIFRADGSVDIVDYKFGNEKRPSHVSQVREYMTLVKDTGVREVRGWLWYVELSSVDRVS